MTRRGTMRALLAGALLAAATAAADGPARGDVRRGSALFVSKACARCHAVWGQGGAIGPDLGLTHAGGLTDSEMAAALWNHIPRMWGKMQEQGIPHMAITEAEMVDLFAYLSFVRALDPPGDAENGRRLLTEKKCGVCHALEEGGAKIAPDLRRWARYRNPAVWAQLMFQHAPQMVTEMKSRGITPPTLDAREMVDIVTYVRSISATDEAELLEPGDTAKGEQLFNDRHCVTCHAIRGKGGQVGPDLGRRGWTDTFTGVAIQTWNHGPAMRRAMAARNIPVPVLTAQEMAHLITYLLSACYADESGSPQQGQKVLEAKGCALCHTSGGPGPSFDKFKGQASAVSLAQALWMHGPKMLERMRELGIRWPSLSGEEMRDLVATFNASVPAPTPPGGK